MVALVRRTRCPFRTAVERDHHVGRQLGDRLGDLGPQLGRVEDLAVGEVPELHVIDADDGRRFPLFALAQRTAFLGWHALDADLAAARQRVVDVLAL